MNGGALNNPNLPINSIVRRLFPSEQRHIDAKYIETQALIVAITLEIKKQNNAISVKAPPDFYDPSSVPSILTAFLKIFATGVLLIQQ